MSEIPQAPWVIAIIHGLTVVGQQRPGNGTPYLEPVYQLQRGLMKTPQGGVVMCAAAPVCMLTWKRMILPADAPTQLVAELPKLERDDIEQAIRSAEGMAEEMRAHNSGLVVAKAPPIQVPTIQTVKR